MFEGVRFFFPIKVWSYVSLPSCFNLKKKRENVYYVIFIVQKIPINLKNSIRHYLSLE